MQVEQPSTKKHTVKMEIDEIKKFVATVQGWLTDEEGKLLYDLAKNCTGEGVIVEVGSWKGRSTIWLGKGSKRGNKVKIYAIDPHTGSHVDPKFREVGGTLEEFKKNIRNAEVDDIIIPVVKTSEEAAIDFHEPVELVFIDGEHSYDSVRLDFESWYPKVKDGGIMAFHDSAQYLGPKKVVEELVCRSRNFRNVRLVNSITFCEKVRQNSVRDRLGNTYFCLLKISGNGHKFANKLNLPPPTRTIVRKLIRLILAV